jgi:AcrR family transcriptional regulator
MTKRRSYNRAGALKAEDWVKAARAVMAEGGIEAVAVEPLARRLGVTKGSFYWHFKHRRALLEATLERWEKESTVERISASRRISDPRERLIRLGEEVFGDAPLDGDASGQGILPRHAFELAVSDAAEDPVVRPVLRRVTEQRVGYLEECYRELGFSPEEARHRALLVYAAHAGTLRLFRDAPDLVQRGEGYVSYRQHLLSTLVPEERADAAEGA